MTGCSWFERARGNRALTARFVTVFPAVGSRFQPPLSDHFPQNDVNFWPAAHRPTPPPRRQYDFLRRRNAYSVRRTSKQLDFEVKSRSSYQ